MRTGFWRTHAPRRSTAITATAARWVCSTFCPDAAIHAAPDGHPEIDYDHCKGCLVCVAVCPSHAIRAVPERQAQAADDEAAR